MIPPNDLEAEEAVLGAMLLSRYVVEDMCAVLLPGDFYMPSHGVVFLAMETLHANGVPVDIATVHAQLKEIGARDNTADLMSMQSNCPAVSHAPAYANTIRKHAAARREMGILSEHLAKLNEGADPTAVADSVMTELQAIDRSGSIPVGLSTFDEVIDNEEADSPVVIPDLAYADTRAILIATEGGGKSTLLRQIAFCASQGIHPFKMVQIEPQRVLVLDLENPRRELRATGHLLRHHARRAGDYDPERLYIFRRPGGLHLRDRAPLSELETVLQKLRPQLVVGGPVYKMGGRKSGETYEEHADATQAILDNLRTRYGFALMLEHHAPRGGKDGRPLVAFGGQRWEAWPDVSIGLVSKDDGRTLEVTRNRPDRGSFTWPDRFTRGTMWPWSATYPTGTF